jgi:hypothetical protein
LATLGRDRLFFDLLLFCGFQIAGFVGLFPEPLNRIENIFLLCQKGIAQLLRPGQIVIHHV